MHDFLADKRFEGLKPFDSKLWLSSPTMHGEEQKWVDETISFNGNNVFKKVREVESASYVGKYVA